MAAVLGLPTAEVEAACNEAAHEGGIAVAANLNAPDQTVISGDPAAVQRAGEHCKARGAKRVVPLKVSGAFHSPLMIQAVDGLHDALSSATFADPAFPVIANVSGEPVQTGNDAKRLLLDQLTAPLRWVDCMRSAALLAPEATFVEVGPGAVLSGLLQRIVPNAPAMTLGTADEVERFMTA
jgi:[acyl-carrier-protein] S-malonyltransferase